VLPARFLRPESVGEDDAGSAAASFFAAEAVGADHLRSVTSVVLTANRPLDWKAFDGWLRTVRLKWSEPMLRVKGLVEVAGAKGPIVVQGVHHVLHAPVELEAWPTVDHGTRLVFIVDLVISNNIRESWTLALPGLLADIAA
jgi:G3E family GTPase